jgi:hypothetical protein
MVNNRFPKQNRYGFELVDNQFAASAARINRKFTSNQIGGIFCKLLAI